MNHSFKISNHCVPLSSAILMQLYWKYLFLFWSLQQQGYCFGFVEFQSLSSMNSAIQVGSLLMISLDFLNFIRVS